ncbi:hypothetical protein [Glycomyces arizonensis]|uniref:hypothetical protein n=1 Tax=Glycomyces arizonensis TaxID=256035 RepID=UPI0012EB789C|nr:hypothetical protein [Glycomyces arizonensis]
MGIFGSREEINFSEPGEISVDHQIASRLPDSGEFLLSFLSDIHPDSYRTLEAEIQRVRHSNGSIPHSNLKGIKIQDWKSGPLTHLVWMTAKDRIIVGVWASFGLSGKDRKLVSSTAERLVDTQGIRAAATWSVATRTPGRLDVDSLGEQLTNSWRESAGNIRNGDVIKSFRKWQR